jgi:hypothetical protein
MIRAIFTELLAREASRYLTRRRILMERELVLSTAQRMRAEMGLPLDRRLRA